MDWFKQLRIFLGIASRQEKFNAGYLRGTELAVIVYQGFKDNRLAQETRFHILIDAHKGFGHYRRGVRTALREFSPDEVMLKPDEDR